MRNIVVFLVLSLIIILSSCAFPSAPTDKTETDTENPPESAVGEATVSREAVFTYDKNSLANKAEIELKLNGEPFLMSAGYVRLAGVIDNQNATPLVLLDVAGRSVFLELNDQIDNYRLVKVIRQTAYLKRENL